MNALFVRTLAKITLLCHGAMQAWLCMRRLCRKRWHCQKHILFIEKTVQISFRFWRDLYLICTLGSSMERCQIICFWIQFVFEMKPQIATVFRQPIDTFEGTEYLCQRLKSIGFDSRSTQSPDFIIDLTKQSCYQRSRFSDTPRHLENTAHPWR